MIHFGKLLFVNLMLITISGCDVEPKKCIESSKVVDILELRYREAVIKLENGQTIVVDQATLKQGEMFCLAYK